MALRMEGLPGVLLDVDPGQLEAARLALDQHLERAALAQRLVVLRDLVVLRHVGVEVVLAREHAAATDRRAERESESQRRLDRRAVGRRQGAGQSQAHWAHVRVTVGPELDRAVEEHLAARLELDVALQAYYRFVGHANSTSWEAGSSVRSPPTSSTRPARSSTGSASSGPSTWTARGNPAADRPAGTVSPGVPARLAPIVKMSLRYIASGSASFSPRRNASVGAAGISMKSQRPKAAWYSARIRARARCAVR